MKRHWTDRDGVEWKVRASGPQLTGKPPGPMPGGPARPGRIIFRREVDGNVLEIGSVDPGWGDPEDLTDAELQRLLDDARAQGRQQ